MNYTIRTIVVGFVVLMAWQCRNCTGEEADKSKWIAIQKTVEVEAKDKDGATIKKQAGISHICVDRTTGDLLAFIPGSGLWKSADQGKTFQQIYESKGKCWSTYSLLIDPLDGKRIFCLQASAPSALTLDGGKTWIAIPRGAYNAMVDWNDPQVKTMFTQDSGHDCRRISHDQGKTWSEPKSHFGKWGFAMGIFDENTYVCLGDDPMIFRSEDGDGKFTAVGKAKREGAIVRNFMILKEHGYALAQGELAISLDKGKTWSVQPTPAGTSVGPYIGKDENQLILVSARQGFFESKDVGKTWNKVIAMPFDVHDLGGGLNHGDNATCGYDPVHDIFYLCSGGQPVQKYPRQGSASSAAPKSSKTK